ncbi:hypothetical protein D3C75_1069830 [compost metagenome]
MPLHRDQLVPEAATQRGLLRQLVRAEGERVLRLAADAVHLAEHLGGQAHHAGRLGHM